MEVKTEKSYVGAKITLKEKRAIQALVKSDDYMNKADFIRTAIREKLRREKVK